MTFDGRFWFWILLSSVTILLLVLLQPILMPFVAGALIAYLADPLVDFLETIKLPPDNKISRGAAVTIVFVVSFGIILLCLLVLIPLLETQIKRFAEVFPTYVRQSLDMVVPYLQNNVGIDAKSLDADQLMAVVTSNLKETGGLLRQAIQTISKSGFAVLGWVANLAMIPLISFYLLRDWDKLVAYIHELLPRNIEPVISGLAKESDERLGAFLRGQLLVMICLSFMYTLGLWLVGLELALLIGLVAGVVSFVPYLGLIVGIGIAGIAILFQTGDPFQLFWVVIVFGFAQMIEGMVLTPVLVGERIGLHPVAVIFFVLAGGQLFGFFGVLLALPVAAVLAVILRHLHDSYKKSQIYRIDID
ncbi:MAG: AI-2E family transporter [Thiolinea sp.]